MKKNQSIFDLPTSCELETMFPPLDLSEFQPERIQAELAEHDKMFKELLTELKTMPIIDAPELSPLGDGSARNPESWEF